MAGEKIMIVEDNAEIRELIVLYLTAGGYRVVQAEDGQKAIHMFEQESPELILLDIYLPGLNGYQVCREIRSVSNIPIIFISSKKDSDDIITGLELGADDYVTKPFDPAVVLARIQANLRRAPLFRRGPLSAEREPVKAIVLAYGGLEIDMDNSCVRAHEKTISLASKEFQLLCYMAQYPGRVFSSEELYEKLWGADSNSDTRTVMVHISNIRKKIEENPSTPKFIQSIRGMGYKFNPVP